MTPLEKRNGIFERYIDNVLNPVTADARTEMCCKHFTRKLLWHNTEAHIYSSTSASHFEGTCSLTRILLTSQPIYFV